MSYICRFWRASKVALRRCSLALPLPYFSGTVLTKLAVLNADKKSVVMLYSLSHAYHVIKHNFLEKILDGSAAEAADATIDVLASAVLRVLSMLPKYSDVLRSRCSRTVVSCRCIPAICDGPV